MLLHNISPNAEEGGEGLRPCGASANEYSCAQFHCTWRPNKLWSVSPLIPHVWSLIPHVSSLIPHVSSLVPRPSCLVPHSSCLVPRPSCLVPHPSSSLFPGPFPRVRHCSRTVDIALIGSFLFCFLSCRHLVFSKDPFPINKSCSEAPSNACNA